MGAEGSRRTAKVLFLSLIVLVGTLTSASLSVSAQTSPPFPLPPGAPVTSCGWNVPKNATIVASSPPDSAVSITIGSPSWEQLCYSYSGAGGSSSGGSSPGFEVFPITIQAPPGTAVTLGAGKALPTPQQIQDGTPNATVWTWLNPDTVTTGTSGMAESNLTLAGAVTPFVPPASNSSEVPLPIVATTSTGAASSVSIPLLLGPSIVILRSPGPLSIGQLDGQAGIEDHGIFGVVYSQPNSTLDASPVQVSMQVLGSYQNGSIGPLPSAVQVSFPQPSFQLQPDSVFYFHIDMTNSLKAPGATSYALYTFAVQETVDNSTYVVPFKVSVNLIVTISEPGLAPSPLAHGSILGVIVLVAAIAIILAVRRREASRQESGPNAPSDFVDPSPKGEG
jgi:hypothetical protein